MKHSIPDDQLQEQLSLYALGALGQHEARAIELHLAEGCEVCSSELRQFESVVDVMGFGAGAVLPPNRVREALLSAIADEAPRDASPVLQQALENYTLRATEGQWTELKPGVFQKHLFSDKSRGTETTLIKLLPGKHLPNHRHLGLEECLIIEGDFNVGGEEFRVGDYRCAMPGTIDDTAFSVSGALLLIVSQGCEIVQ
ncbi:MAG TPA: cupin domain-containing protein [Pyrinomonadaceae bacterium]|nr:cupin domain-containing protein [Pyrinomonadaceae bacterium]